MAVFYAAIANEGLRPTPHVIELIDRRRRVRLSQGPKLTPLPGVDRPAAFQLRTILQGVVARGTARSIAQPRRSSAARPAPATSRTTPGSSASATTSPSRSGSATTTPAASARSAAARPAARSRCRSSNRSCRRCGSTTRRKTALRGPSPGGADPADRAADRSCAAASGWTATAAASSSVYFDDRSNRRRRRVHGILPARRKRPRSPITG